MSEGIVVALIGAAAVLVVAVIGIAARRREGSQRHSRDWNAKAAHALVGARSVLENSNPLRLVVGFSATGTSEHLESQIDRAREVREELGMLKAGHPSGEVREAAGELGAALMESVGAVAIYVRAIAQDHDSASRERRAHDAHDAATGRLDDLATALDVG